MTIKRLAPFGIVLIAGFAAAIIQYYPLRRSASPPIPVVIATLRTPHSGLVLIAEAKGYFAEEGLSATVKTALTGYEAIGQVLKGEADVGGAAETPIARTLAEGKDIRVIATTFSSSLNVGIVTRKDHGIFEPADLKGKKIGFVYGTATHYMLETFLAFHGIPVESVSLIQVNPNDTVSALISGDLDAAASWIPYLSRMQQQLEDNSRTFYPTEFYNETLNLVVRPDYLAHNREAAERLLRALLKAELFAADHPDEADQIIASASNIEAGFLGGAGDPMPHEVTLKQSVLLATENEVRWCFRRGLAPQTASFPDVLKAFETEPLRAVKPSAVSIVKAKK